MQPGRVLELMELRRNLAQSAANGIRVRLAKASSYEDYHEAIDVFNSQFEALLGLTMIQWRHGAGDPRTSLEEALTVAHQVAPVVIGLRPEHRAALPFDFGLAALCGRFLRNDFDPTLVEMVPVAEEFIDLEEAYLPRVLTVALVLALLQGKPTNLWRRLLPSLRGRKKKDLLIGETYRCYMRLTEASQAQHWDEVLAAVQTGYDLYPRRKADPGYKHATFIEGGGDANEHVIDIRLACLIQVCLSPRPDLRATLPPPHVWRF